jgi:hypothetical protein
MTRFSCHDAETHDAKSVRVAGRDMAIATALRIGLGTLAVGASALLGLAPGSPAFAEADPNAITVTVAPAEVTLTPGAETRVTVIVANPSDKSQAVTVDAIPSDNSITVTPPEPDPSASQIMVVAKSSMAFQFSVKRDLDGTGQTQGVQFLAIGSGTQLPSNAASADLKINAAKTADLFTAAISPDLKELKVNEYRPADTSIVITNERGDPMNVSTITLRVPEQVTATVTCPGSRASDEEEKKNKEAIEGGDHGKTGRLTNCVDQIAPRSQAVVPVHLAVGDTLTPGSRTLSAVVQAETAQKTDATTIAADASFDVEVFAESDILKAIGVPIFLLLPGAIIVLSSAWLISKATGWRRALSGPPAPSFNTLSVEVLVSLAVSLVFAAVYPWATMHIVPMTRRDYLRTQGFNDFYYVILWSFIVAVLIWILSQLLYWTTSHWFIFREGDTATDVLRKVKARSNFGKPVQFLQVKTGKGDRDKGVRVRGLNASKTELVAPRILYTPPTDPNSDAGTAATNYDDSPTAKNLRALIKEHGLLDSNSNKIAFDQTDLPAPREVPIGEAAPNGVYLRAILIRRLSGDDQTLAPQPEPQQAPQQPARTLEQSERPASPKQPPTVPTSN